MSGITSRQVLRLIDETMTTILSRVFVSVAADNDFYHREQWGIVWTNL